MFREKEVLNSYDKEINNGITKSFIPLSYNLNVQYKNTSDQLENIKTNLTTVRNILKEKMVITMIMLDYIDFINNI